MLAAWPADRLAEAEDIPVRDRLAAASAPAAALAAGQAAEESPDRVANADPRFVGNPTGTGKHAGSRTPVTREDTPSCRPADRSEPCGSPRSPTPHSDPTAGRSRPPARASTSGKKPRMRNCVTEFRVFLLRGNLIDLAVGIVIGVAFGALVNAFVKDLITPIIAAIFGKQD